MRIGHSRLGREIFAYEWRLGGENSGADRPGIALLSLLHPMEWIGRECLLALLEGWILPAGSPNPEGRPPVPSTPALPAGTPIYALPTANPDAVAGVEEALRAGRWGWFRGNAAGIDLNRNFPRDHRRRASWIDWWPMWRPGPEGLSEPETQAIAGWVEERKIAVALSLHSFGRWIFYPPSARWRPDGETTRHREPVRRALVPATGERSSRYRESQLGRWSPFFRAYGTEIDFLQERTRGLAYLVEVSGGGFGRWGLRRLPHPFFTFNPPHPERELERLLPILWRLIGEALGGR